MSLKRMQKITNHFRNSGLHMMGSGAYGEVWSNDSKNTVYKIGTYDHKDKDGWFYFASWVVNNNIRNPYFPRIKHLSGRPTFYVAEIEKLSDQAPKTDKYNEIRCNFSDSFRTFQNCGTSYRDRWLRSIYDYGELDKFEFLTDDRFWEAMDLVKTAFLEYEKLDIRLHWDVHAGNCMYRENQLVITDPWTMAEYSYSNGGWS